MEKVKSNKKIDRRVNIKYRAYNFSLHVIKFVNNFPNKRTYWVFQDQLLRSATSIGANIIEAQAASSKKDFINFYQIAYKSSKESTYWLCLLRDSGLIEKQKVKKVFDEAVELSKMLSASLMTLKGKKKK